MSVISRLLRRPDAAAADLVVEPMRRRDVAQIMPIEQIVALALVQGLTEFLPISSSAKRVG